MFKHTPRIIEDYAMIMMRRQTVFIVLLLCMPVFPCLAQDGDYILEDEYKPTYNVEMRWSTEATGNVFSTSDNREKDTLVNTGLSGTAEFPRGPDAILRVDFDMAHTEFRKFASEDHMDTALDISWEQPLGAGRAGVSGRFHEIDASNQAVSVLASNDHRYQVFYSHPLGAADTLRMETFKEEESFADYDSLQSQAHGWRAALSHDFGDFIYGDFSYEVKRTHYPAEAIVDISYNETPGRRSDRTSTFSASVSRVVSFYPLTYIQVTHERITNSSDSMGYYFWFNETSLEYGEKLVPGYDDYKETALSAFALTDLSDKTSLSVYYLVDKTRYPTRYIGNFGEDEPFKPTENTLTYAMVDIQHVVNETLTVDLSRTWVNSRANDPLYEYSDQLLSVGLISKF